MAGWATERNHIFQVGGTKEQASRILDGLTDPQPWFSGIIDRKSGWETAVSVYDRVVDEPISCKGAPLLD